MQFFEPISIKGCVDVGMELKKITELYAFEEHMVSFDILRISTFYRGEKKKDFSLLEGQERARILSDDAEYNKNDFEIKQVYDILLRGLKKGDLAPFVGLKMDSECYELVLELKEGLEVRNDDTFFEELYTEITRKKICQHIIVRLFDEDIKQEINALKELFSHLNIQGKIQSSQSIALAKASGFIPEMGAKFIFTLKDEWNKTHTQSIDFASYAAKSGDLVGLSLKPQVGVSGRNLKGEYIHAKKHAEGADIGNEEAKLKIKDNEFRKEEKEGSIEYYALQDGYVGMSEGELRVITDFNFAEVSSRKNGSLLGGDKKGFVVEVTCGDPNQDAIGAGITLEASEIKIFGSVAENTKIVGKKIEINGQTHQSSTIKADEVNIDLHKGEVMGDKVRVERLELGNIDGEEVFIEQANGGTIKARNITIATLHSHTKIFVSEHLHIKNMSGGENRFTLSSRASLKAQEEVQSITEQITQNIQEMNTLLAVLNKDLVRVRKTKPVVEKIKAIMEENKKNKKPNERNIIDSMAQYVILLQRTKYLKERLVALKQQSRDLDKRLESLDKQTQDAKITSDVAWQKENEVVYESFFPESKDIMILSDGEEVNIGINKGQLKLVREVRS